MIEISIIVQVRECGPNGPGRIAIGLARYSTKKAVPDRNAEKKFRDALDRAIEQREAQARETAELASRQSQLFQEADA